jgi:peroxiredoxin Q/BCP
LAKVGLGDRAPDFTLKDQNGRAVSLHDFARSKNVVIYFYPKDFTPGCTAETKTFGAVYDEITRMGAEVLGISTGTVESHKDFAEGCGAKFSLLADEDGKVMRLYEVQRSMWLIPGRVIFVIDKEGVVRSVFSSQVNAAGHVAEAIKALKSITA